MSQKHFVQQGMAQLESGEIQPPARKVGRPRKYPPGFKKWELRKDPNVDPAISAARAEAGRKGQAVQRRKHLLESERQKLGREFQAVFDPQLAAVKIEVANINPETDSFHQIDSLVWACKNLLEGHGWNRTYYPPTEFADYNEEHAALDDEPEDLQRELQKSFGSYPEIDAEMITGYASRIKLEELPLTKQLVIRALEAFLDFAKYQDARVLTEIERTIPRVERSLPKVKDGTIFNPPRLPEPKPPIPTEFFSPEGKPMYLEFHNKTYGNWSDLHAFQASLYGAYGPDVMLEDIKQKERQLQVEREAQILANKTTEARKKYEEERLRQERFQQQNLPSEALIFLHGRKY